MSGKKKWILKRKKYDGIKDGINDGKKSNNIERKILY